MIGGSKVTITKSDSGSSSLISLFIAVIAILILLYLIGLYYKKHNNCVNKEEFENFNNVSNDLDEVSSSILDNNPLIHTDKDTISLYKKPNIKPKKKGNCLVNQFPVDEYPKDKLNPMELLPADPNSKWAQVNPSGQGELGDQNFLEAGFHIGINSVGQSLRNPNLQLRSEPPCPQVQVSPWLQSTIDPDINRRAFEVGNC